MYAEVGGKPLSVVKSKETNEYVVSWLEETKKAPRGNFEIKVYDDEGYAALRKVILFNLICKISLKTKFHFCSSRPSVMVKTRAQLRL